LKLLAKIDYRIPEFIYSDISRVLQVLIGIVGWSLKTTTKGFVEIKISKSPIELGDKVQFDI